MLFAFIHYGNSWRIGVEWNLIHLNGAMPDPIKCLLVWVKTWYNIGEELKNFIGCSVFANIFCNLFFILSFLWLAKVYRLVSSSVINICLFQNIALQEGIGKLLPLWINLGRGMKQRKVILQNLGFNLELLYIFAKTNVKSIK